MARPSRPLPSEKGWIDSNHRCASAARIGSGRVSRGSAVRKSSIIAGTCAAGGARYSTSSRPAAAVLAITMAKLRQRPLSSTSVP